MKNIALFACDNGLGHIRRTLLLSNILSKFFKVNFFIQKKKIKKFLKPSEAKIINFKLNFKNKKKYYLQNNYIRKFKSKNLSAFDAVYSDNFPEIIYTNKKAFIFANFFWHYEFDIKRPLYRNLNKEICHIFLNLMFSADVLLEILYLRKISFETFLHFYQQDYF